MVQNLYYHLIDAIVYIITAAIPVYFILKSRKSIDSNNNNLLRLTIVLVSFILLQVFYHIAGIAGFRLLAKGLLEPLSMAALLVFGIIYIISIWNAKRQQQQQELET
jgi:lipopolysaccharide export LptBFGC system permease protein LptF